MKIQRLAAVLAVVVAGCATTTEPAKRPRDEWSWPSLIINAGGAGFGVGVTATSALAYPTATSTQEQAMWSGLALLGLGMAVVGAGGAFINYRDLTEPPAPSSPTPAP